MGSLRARNGWDNDIASHRSDRKNCLHDSHQRSSAMQSILDEGRHCHIDDVQRREDNHVDNIEKDNVSPSPDISPATHQFSHELPSSVLLCRGDCGRPIAPSDIEGTDSGTEKTDAIYEEDKGG